MRVQKPVERTESASRTARGLLRYPFFLGAFWLLGFRAASGLFAQTPLPDDFSPVAASTVYALGVQTDGKILVGGVAVTPTFTPRVCFVRFQPDGTLDRGFSPAIDGRVKALAVQTDGKILIGGSFNVINGEWRRRIARLNADGSLDSAFDLGTENNVNTLTVQADGKVLVGGAFTTLAGQTRNYLGRLNADGSLDASFDPGANAAVYALTLQADGKILVGGDFSTLGGQLRSRLARLQADGTLDSGFNPGADGAVFAFAVQPDGKILVAGAFTALAGQPRSHIARLNADGTLDDGFSPGADNSIYTLGLQADGKVLVGGDFSVLGGQPRSRIGRLQADGTLDPEFNPDADGTVQSLVALPDGKILLGGNFTTLGGLPRARIARLNSLSPPTQSLVFDGSSVTWLRGGPSPEVWRTTFDLSTDGLTWANLGLGTPVAGGWQLSGVTIPAGTSLRARGWVAAGYLNGSGWFVETFGGALFIAGQPSNQVARIGETAAFGVLAGGIEPLNYQWFKDGVALADTGPFSGANTPTLTLTNVSKANEGGYSVVITNAEGSRTSLVARLTVDDPFILVSPVGQSREPEESVTFTVTAGGTPPLTYQWWHEGVEILGATNSTLTLTNLHATDTGDYLATVSNPVGTATSAVARLLVNLLDGGFSPATGWVYALAEQPDGKILVGGRFTTLAGEPRTNIARINADGTLDREFNPGANGDVYSLAVQPDGKILVGGGFTSLGGQPRNYLGRLNADGTLDNGFDPKVSAYSYVYTLALQPDGKLLVGGTFSALGGQPRNNLGRLNSDGTLDSDFNPGPAGTVFSLAVEADGKILVCSAFSTARIRRLNADGTLDTTFNPIADSDVYSITVQADGKILVGGRFTTLNGQPRRGIGRLLADGTLDVTFNAIADSAVYSITVQADGNILAVGRFTALGGQARDRIARINPDGTLDNHFNPGADSDVYALAVQADGSVLVGGAFSSLAGQTRSCLGRLNNTVPAARSLRYEDSTITWLRGGSSPEVSRATFELSTNGVDWVNLGASARVQGGWALSGLAIPTGSTLRARGFVSGGRYNGSCWFVEDYLGVPTPSLSLRSVGPSVFAFGVEGINGVPWMLQSTTNLGSTSDWQTLWTGLLTNGTHSLLLTNRGEPGRYFRARQP